MGGVAAVAAESLVHKALEVGEGLVIENRHGVQFEEASRNEALLYEQRGMEVARKFSTSVAI